MPILVATARLNQENNVDLDFRGVPEVKSLSDARASFDWSTRQFGDINIVFKGSNLREDRRLNVDGRVDKIVVKGDGGELYRVEGFESSTSYAARAVEFSFSFVSIFDGADQLNGSRFGDIMNGFSGADTIRGAAGDDRLDGELGRDDIRGGAGDDLIFGGGARDQLFGGGGADTLFGGRGRDDILGGGGSDQLLGDDGADRLLGGGGRDELAGGDAGDRLFGGDGGDSFSGDDGRDKLFGGASRDLISGGDGRDRLTGGTGRDTLSGGDKGDRFVFLSDDGADTITDFDQDGDRVDLAKVQDIRGFLDLSRNHLSQDGADAVIDYVGGSVRLSGVDASALTADDFIF